MKRFLLGRESSFVAVALACAFLGTACNDTAFAPGRSFSQTEPPAGINVASDAYQIAASGTTKADLLFCIDNSGSMADDQTLLANNFSAFIDGFVKEGVDYHIGMITTDISSTDPKYWSSKLPGYVNPNLGKLITRSASDPFLTSATSDLVNKFRANAQVGTTGSGYEQCLGSIIAALDATKLTTGGANSGFLRDDSLLSIIIVSDEDETITNGQSPSARIQQLKDRVVALRGPNSRGFRFDFVVNKSAKKPATPPAPDASNRPYPDIYYQAATAFAALTYDVTKDFSNDLLKIATGIVNQAQSEFKLTSLPKTPSAIYVKLGSQNLVQNSANGFIYHADRNTIELQGMAIDEAPGQLLTITYDVK